MKILLGSLPGAYWGMCNAGTNILPNTGKGQSLLETFIKAKHFIKPEYFILETPYKLPRGVFDYIYKKLNVSPIPINANLFSAQNKARFFWVGVRAINRNYHTVKVKLPTHNSLVVSSILQSGIPFGARVYKLRPDSLRYTPQTIYNTIRVATAQTQTGKPNKYDSRQYRVYSPFGKGVTLCGNAGGGGAITGLYMVPVRNCNFNTYNVVNGHMSLESVPRKVSLPDGKYIVRKLTVRECMRLQTIPDTYKLPVNPDRALKLIGNTPTVDVFAHILNQLPGVSLEPLEVLSVFDGISAGQIALDKIGADVIQYTAVEENPYAVKVTRCNFPKTKYIEKRDL